jgi:hypothetical protein
VLPSSIAPLSTFPSLDVYVLKTCGRAGGEKLVYLDYKEDIQKRVVAIHWRCGVDDNAFVVKLSTDYEVIETFSSRRHSPEDIPRSIYFHKIRPLLASHSCSLPLGKRPLIRPSSASFRLKSRALTIFKLKRVISHSC